MQVGLQDYVVEQTTAEWTLYHNDFSLCSRKVRICLHEAGFNYESKHIDLIETGKYEVASKSFLKINPGATTFEVIFLDPSSLAKDLEKPTIADFDEE